MVEVVQDDADGDAVHVGEVADEIEGLDLVAEVEVVGRLVEEDNTRLLGQACGEPYALDFAAGEFADGAVGPGAHAGRVECVFDGGPVVAAHARELAAVGVAAEGDDLADAQPLGRAPRLREERDFLGELSAAGRGHVPEGCIRSGAVETAEHHPAVGGGVESCEAAQQGRFAGAVRPDEGSHATGHTADRTRAELRGAPRGTRR